MTIQSFLAKLAGLAVALSCLPVHAVPTRVSAGAGEVRDFLSTANATMFAATQGGGLFKTTDTGANWAWVSTLPARYIWKIAQSPAAPARIYVAAETGIFRSVDSGATWTQLTFDPAKAIAVSPASTAGTDTLIAGVSGVGLIKSADSGATWARVGTAAQMYNTSGLDPIAVAYASGTSVFAAYFCNRGDFRHNQFEAFGGVYQSTDSGANWADRTTIGIALPTKCVTSMAISNTTAPAGVTVLVGTRDVNGNGSVHRSFNGGTWSNPGTSNAGGIFGVDHLSVDKNSPNTFWAGSRTFGPWKSTDGGVNNWAGQYVQGTDPDFQSNALSIGTFPASTNVMADIKGLGAFRFTTVANRWDPVVGLTADRVTSLSTHFNAAPNSYWISLKGGGFMFSSNAGTSWQQANGGLADGNGDLVQYATAIGAHPLSATTVYGVTMGYGLYQINTGTRVWGPLLWGQSPADATDSLIVRSDDGMAFYAMFNGGANGGLRKGTPPTASAGVPLNVDGNPGAGIAAGSYKIWQSPSNASLIYLLMYDSIPYRSGDGGNNWQRYPVTEPNPGFLRTAFFDITEKPGTNGQTMVASTNKGLFRSTDYGGSWNRIAITGLGVQTPSTIVYSANNVLWAADRGGGFYCSTNDGANWVPVSLGALPPAAFVEARIVNNQVHLTTDGAGIYKNPTTSCP